MVYEASGHAVSRGRSTSPQSGGQVRLLAESNALVTLVKVIGIRHRATTTAPPPARMVLSRVKTTRTGTRYYTRMKLTGGTTIY